MVSFKSILLVLLWMYSHLVQISNSDDNDTNLDMDKFTKDYISEVKRTLKLDSEEHTINKRSHGDKDFFQLRDIDLLVGFQETFTLPIKYANDLILFSQCASGSKSEHKLYAAALQVSPHKALSNDLILYSYQDAVWKETYREKVLNGVRLAAEQIDDTIYIIVAEHHAEFNRGSTVFRINSESATLEFEHILRSTQQFPSDVIMWKWEGMVTFAAVANSENPPGATNRYSTQSPVYRWRGSHFDMIHTLPTYNPRALTQFNIRSFMFIAVANFQNDNGETSVDSDIFRYNVATNKFTLYQKLPTEAAVDIKYFCYLGDHISESFLIYASAYHTDEEGQKDYNTASIVYKLSDEGYFVPFQAIRVRRVTGWLPVRLSKNNKEGLVLVGATVDGIVSYQYDGWRFVPTGVHYDRSAFGLGPKSIRAFYYNDQTFISAANRQSASLEYNVLSPVLKHHALVEELQERVSAWEQRMSVEVAAGQERMTALLEAVRTAPSVEDPHIKLGSHVFFHNVEIENVVTYKTKVGGSDQQTAQRLRSFRDRLDRLHQQLEGLQDKIDESTFHTRTIYEEDAMETSADIVCTLPCKAEELIVTTVNGDDMQEFLADTVNIKEPLEFDMEITFEKLALIDPLDTKMINGHSVDSVIDWSKKVVLDQGLQVEGTVFLENELTVVGTVDGVSLNNIEEVVVMPTKTIKTLNASQLLLSDGKLSQVDFREFSQSTLKTHGDQLITEFQDWERIEADALEFKDGLYSAMAEGKSSPIKEEDDRNKLKARHSETDDLNPESNNVIEDEIVLQYDVVYHGTIIIQNGTLSAEDFIDSKRNISARNILEFGIPLKETVINKHFIFECPFKADNLTVDTLNGVDLAGLVDLGSPEPVVVRGRKEFRRNLVVDGAVRVEGTVNGVNLTEGTDVVEELSTFQLENLTVHSINGTSIQVNGTDWSQIVKIREDGKVYLRNLEVEEDMRVGSIMLRGHINNFHLEKLLLDTVYSDGKLYEISGTKHFMNKIDISNITVNTLNGVDVNNLTPSFVWKARLSHAKVVRVGNLTYTGKLDGIDSQEFGEWLLTEGDQTVYGMQTINKLQANNVTMSPSAQLNNINIHRLITEAVFLTDNATLDTVTFDSPVEAAELSVGGRLAGLRLPDDVVLSDTDTSQQVSAHKHVQGSVTVLGDLRPVGLLSSVSLPAYCRVLSLANTSLVVGNATFKEEPFISNSINKKKWTDLMEHVWFREDNINIKSPVLIFHAQFNKLAVETINRNDVEKALSNLVSVSQDQTINGTFYFPNVTMSDGLEVETGRVEGEIQGLHLQSFVEEVMLDGEDQEIWGYPDFTQLTVDGVLVNKGYVNNLNLTKDLLLTNAMSNTITGSLSLHQLTADSLILPSGSLVAGVDLSLWNSSAVKKSIDNRITGNVVFKGQFDSSNGIRVEGLVNGVQFDKDHVMLRNGSQEITGVKIFSSNATLAIERLQVRGYLNDLNITEFYNQQVMNVGNVTLTGTTRFMFPLYSRSVSLPEMYQGHNLTWLESQLASPLPRSSYNSLLDRLYGMRQLAEKSIAGRAFYLKNITRLRDIQGVVLYALPLQTEDSTLVATVRKHSNKTTLTLLHWNAKYQSFLDKPGSRKHILNVVPSSFMSVVMPGGEMAGYVTRFQQHSDGYGQVFRLKGNTIEPMYVHGGKPSSQVFSFRDNSGRTCFLVVNDICSVYCPINKTLRANLPSFACQNIFQASLLTTDKSVYLLGLQAASTNLLVVWKLSGKSFVQVLSIPQFNPVSIAATMTTGPHIAVATRHLVGNTHPETIDIYRFNEELLELWLEQSLPTISPKKVLFADLPSDESAMYVASDNPASPLEVFLYRGILGYQRFAVDQTLHRPLDIHAVTDHHHRHFVLVSTEKRASVFQAHFQEEFTPSKV
uniref:Uncharacterized protein n=1 Tax=Graphocephala atropunctata TaxID=36148 RepID=A0A1B6MAK0_9HEMI